MRATKKTSRTDIVYYVQSRDQRFRRYWNEWGCCSPHFAECPEARRSFEDQASCGLWPEQFRLVRAVFRQERLPLKTRLYANVGSDIKVLARKEGES